LLVADARQRHHAGMTQIRVGVVVLPQKFQHGRKSALIADLSQRQSREETDARLLVF
jgi:hypothetical protein